LLKVGAIVAIKGIGGFHLAGAANQEETVKRLRQRKHRYDKPLALMARDLEMIEDYCWVGEEERELLKHQAAPIVLLRKKYPHKLPEAIAPYLNYWGFLLPYTPLHHLIVAELDFPLVFTSGNLSEEPQCISNEAARQQLAALADYFLLHNREIVNRLDDSVVRVVEGQTLMLRRARGYAPSPLPLPPGFPETAQVLGMGGELKNTFCLLRQGEAILSQHLGDLENAQAYTAYQEALNLYLNLFTHQPEIIAVDKHPEYLATKLGKAIAVSNNLPLVEVQHHHAHICAVMGEQQLPLEHPPVLGIALDGLGYGEKGELWGGEFLLADYRQARRVAHLEPVALLGGEQAMYQPWRNTYAYLRLLGNWDEIRRDYAGLEWWQFLGGCAVEKLELMLAQGINSPLASSTGRLFDAVAGILGICRERVSYEGQAAILLEARAQDYLCEGTVRGYPWALKSLQSDSVAVLSSQPMWYELLTDLRQGKDLSYIAAAFQVGLGEAIAKTVAFLQSKYDFNTVVLSGGVWQNTLLLTQVKNSLSALNFRLVTHKHLPSNDGGISLGQALIALARNLT
jgi:hydrogenase maturation protein HypF